MKGQAAYRALIGIMAAETGRKSCNCGEAFYNKDGSCEYGCNTNLMRAKFEVAERISTDPRIAAAEEMAKAIQELLRYPNTELYPQGHRAALDLLSAALAAWNALK